MKDSVSQIEPIIMTQQYLYQHPGLCQLMSLTKNEVYPPADYVENPNGYTYCFPLRS